MVRSGYGCNSRCLFCDQGDLRGVVPDLSDAAVEEAIVAAVDAAPGAPLVLSGGEITLRPALPGWVRLARERGAGEVLIQTNARMLAYREFADALVEAGADVIAAALHGPMPELHDYLTGSPGSYGQALKGIRNARRAGARIQINSVVTKPGYRHSAELVALAARMGAEAVRFHWPRPAGHLLAFAPQLVPSREMAKPHLAHARQVGRRLQIAVSFDGSRHPSKKEGQDDSGRASAIRA